jgi:hypothetical protein
MKIIVKFYLILHDYRKIGSFEVAKKLLFP